MRDRITQLMCGAGLLGIWLLASGTSITAEPQHRRPPAARHRTPSKKAATPTKLPCGDVLGFQVLLDRQGISPGQIDGFARRNLTRALSAYQKEHKIASSGRPDCETWRALGGDSSGAAP